jgi:hypothetical protein
MWRKENVFRIAAGLSVCLLLLFPAIGRVSAEPDEPPTEEEVRAAIAAGTAWLASQQEGDGSWPHYERCAVTAMAIKKLEHHAVDRRWGLGLPSPFHEANPYKSHIEAGFAWLFANCAYTKDIGVQPAGDPDSDGDGIGVYWQWGGNDWHQSYTTGLALMALCEAVELDRVIEGGPLVGWTYEEAARDTMDDLSFGQNDAGPARGGWGYYENHAEWSDNSNTGYVTLGLGFAEAPPPQGCGFEIPQFVKDELNIWVDYIQNDVNGDTNDGGSGYTGPDDWVNILKTGNLLQQMQLVGDAPDSGRVQDALDYMARHWDDANQEPGWRGWDGSGTSNYQAMFTAMKGFTSLGIEEFGDPAINWAEDFETELLAEQHPDGSWPDCYWGDDLLCTTWALFTLQRVAPIPAVPVDIKPGSCPNPINVKEKGVIPVAILGFEGFDAAEIDPASVTLMGVAPLRWALEDVGTPYIPFLNKEDAYDCNELGPDGSMDLTLKFSAQEVIEALGEVWDGDVLILELTGARFDGRPFLGEDVVVIRAKGK